MTQLTITKARQALLDLPERLAKTTDDLWMKAGE